jgi:hypothetical protein
MRPLQTQVQEQPTSKSSSTIITCNFPSPNNGVEVRNLLITKKRRMKKTQNGWILTPKRREAHSLVVPLRMKKNLETKLSKKRKDRPSMDLNKEEDTVSTQEPTRRKMNLTNWFANKRRKKLKNAPPKLCLTKEPSLLK